MAIAWGAWEGSSPNRIRVGIDVDWGAVSNADTQVTATVRIYVDVEGNWSDTQTLSMGGYIGGSVTFSNNQDNSQALRATRSYTYTYPSGSYGSSPAERRFTASLSGAFNGATPSKVVDSNVPARPYAAPYPPISTSASRVSDTSTRISWTNRDTAGRPWHRIYLQRSVNGGGFGNTITISGGASSYVFASVPNTKYRFRVASDNDIATSAYDDTYDIWTTPAAPSAAVRTGANGADQVIDWSNAGMGYSEYSTEVWRSQNGVWDASPIATLSGPTATHTDTFPASNPGIRFKYRVRHRTTSGSQGVLYSAWSEETTETAGTTSPPNAPTDLAPADTTVDPTILQRLSWTFSPTTVGDTQQAYTLRHRQVGAASWNEVVATSANTYYDLPKDTYDPDVFGNTQVEWQVATKGSDPVYGPFADSVTFLTAVTPIAPDPVKVPMVLNLTTGEMEASFARDEIRDYTMRAQSQLMGGGQKAVDSSFNISWGSRFIAMALGRSATTFRGGYHEIVNPYGLPIASRSVTAGIATITMSTAILPFRMRVGETVTINGLDATWNGDRVIRSVSCVDTTATVTFELATADMTAAAGGACFPRITGHAGASSVVSASQKTPLASWTGLYYDMPFGWGSGITPRKNGVMAVTNKELTSNKATLTLSATSSSPHYFAVGDSVIIGIGDPVFDGTVVLTEVTPTTISYTKTNANIASQAASGLATPSGKDTFFGNFHVVNYQTEDFVPPSSWLLLAVRNGDSNRVEWITGENMAADTQQGGGWQTPSWNAGWGTSTMQYRVIGDQVFLRGEIIRTSGSGTTACVLPSYARPTQSMGSMQRSGSGVIAFAIGFDGSVVVGSALPNNQAMYLDNVTYLNS